MADHYEIRRGSQPLCESSIKNLGYPVETIRQMLKAGYTLFKNGKRVKQCELE